jgi:hypothetical protein
MSALGHKQTSETHALNVCFTPESGHQAKPAPDYRSSLSAPFKTPHSHIGIEGISIALALFLLTR